MVNGVAGDHRRASTKPAQVSIEGLAQHEVMQNVPNKPEVVLRVDDLLIPAAATPLFWGASLAATRWSYSPS